MVPFKRNFYTQILLAFLLLSGLVTIVIVPIDQNKSPGAVTYQEDQSIKIPTIVPLSQLEMQQRFESVTCRANTPEATITLKNDLLAIELRPRVAGAIDSISFKGRETVNDGGHGQQIQYSFEDPRYRECFKPSEAGRSLDHKGNTSTSELIESCALDKTSAYTKIRPAYWAASDQLTMPVCPGDPYCNSEAVDPVTKKMLYCPAGINAAQNTTDVSPSIFSKIVDIGYGRSDTIVHLLFRLEFNETTDGLEEILLELPTGYHTGDFNQYYFYDVDTAKLTQLSENDADGEILPWTFAKILSTSQLPVLSNGEVFIAAYSPTEYTQQYSLFGFDHTFLSDEDKAQKWNVLGTIESPQKGEAYFVETLIFYAEEVSELKALLAAVSN